MHPPNFEKCPQHPWGNSGRAIFIAAVLLGGCQKDPDIDALGTGKPIADPHRRVNCFDAI